MLHIIYIGGGSADTSERTITQVLGAAAMVLLLYIQLYTIIIIAFRGYYRNNNIAFTGSGGTRHLCHCITYYYKVLFKNLMSA